MNYIEFWNATKTNILGYFSFLAMYSIDLTLLLKILIWGTCISGCDALNFLFSFFWFSILGPQEEVFMGYSQLWSLDCEFLQVCLENHEVLKIKTVPALWKIYNQLSGHFLPSFLLSKQGTQFLMKQIKIISKVNKVSCVCFDKNIGKMWTDLRPVAHHQILVEV